MEGLLGTSDYQVFEASSILADIRMEGDNIIRKVLSLLNQNHVVILDCSHPLGREHHGKFTLVQLESKMFSVVCDSCAPFALMGEPIAGEGIPVVHGKA